MRKNNNVMWAVTVLLVVATAVSVLYKELVHESYVPPPKMQEDGAPIPAPKMRDEAPTAMKTPPRVACVYICVQTASTVEVEDNFWPHDIIRVGGGRDLRSLVDRSYSMKPNLKLGNAARSKFHFTRIHATLSCVHFSFLDASFVSCDQFPPRGLRWRLLSGALTRS